MAIGIDFGLDHMELEVAETRLVEIDRAPSTPALADPERAMREALDAPFRFPPLWRSLTPDDHVAIVVEERLPRVGALLIPILENVSRAAVPAGAITLVCPPSDSSQDWIEELPEEFEDVHVEVHDPTNRQRLSYLAATKQGHRLYLNRTAVDADQLVVLGRCGYDPLTGYAGFEGDIYPALSDEATRRDVAGRLSMAAPDAGSWPTLDDAREAAWLLGAPFLVQVIEGTRDTITHVVAGSLDSAKEGQRLLNARWHCTVEQPAETVVVAVAGQPKRHDFAELARALACASRVVQPGGRIVLLCQAAPKLGPGAELLRKAQTPAQALSKLRELLPADMAAAFQWASAAERARLYVLCGLPEETTEELFAVPLQNPEQVQRLLQSVSGSCLVMSDANKTLAVVETE